MRYFFFHHPLNAFCRQEPSQFRVPGRYAFSVSGLLVGPDCVVTERQSFQVATDAFGENIPGPNVDPNIFASPLPIVHAYCRLDRRGSKYYVAGTQQNLAQTVNPNDIIFYGHIQTRGGKPLKVYVDTVVVVKKSVSFPTEPACGRRHRLKVNDDFAHSLLSLAKMKSDVPLQELQSSDLWKMSLADSSEGQSHEYTYLEDHLIIVGSAASTDKALIALQKQTTSFVPLVQEGQGEDQRPLPPFVDQNTAPRDLWERICSWISENPRLAKGLKPPTLIGDKKLGEALYNAIRAASGQGTPFPGYVALPPLCWQMSPLIPSNSG